jgi:hypothetical protein
MFAAPAAKSDGKASPPVETAPSSGAPAPVPTAGAPATDAVVEDTYRDALAYLGARRAAGHLDSDLALKAAEQLGHRYRERREETADDARKRAAQAAHQIRSELAGSALQALDIESQRVSAVLAGLRRANLQPVAGWEQEVIASATRLIAIATRIAELARSHTRAAADSFSTPRR